MSTVDFRTLLQTPMDTIEKPKPLPAGTYHGVVARHEFGESSQKKTPYVRFWLQPLSAADDVDPAMLEGVDLSKKLLRRDYFLTTDALFRLKAFLDSVGVNTTGRSLGEAIPDSTNARVLMQVTQRTADNGDQFNDVGDLKGAE